MPWVLWVLGGAAALRAGVGLLVLWDGRRPARAAAPAEPAPRPVTGWWFPTG